MALNSTAINGSSLNGGGSSYFKDGAAVAVLGLAASAYISVIQPAAVQATIATASYDVSMRVETNGYGQTLTDLEVSGGGTRWVKPIGAGAVCIDTSCTAAVTRYMAGVAQAGINASGRGRVATWGYGDAVQLHLTPTAEGTRRVPALGSQVRTSISTDSAVGSKVHYTHVGAALGLACTARQTVTQSGSIEHAQFGFVSLSAGGIRPEDAYISLTASGSGNPIIGYRGRAEVAVTGTARQMVLSDAKGAAVLSIDSVAQPAINGIHEATAIGSFGKVVASDDARVRTNVYGLADFGFGSMARAWTRLYVAAKTTVGFSADPLLWNIASLADAATAFDFSASVAGPTRTRLSKGIASFSVDSFEYSTIIRGYRADGACVLSGVGAGQTSRGFKAVSEIALSPETGWINVYRRVNTGMQHAGYAFSSLSQPFTFRHMAAFSGLELLTARAEPGSNLSRPAPEFRTFIVPGYIAEFAVPDDDRRFVA